MVGGEESRMSKVIMIQGTMSNEGKSLIAPVLLAGDTVYGKKVVQKTYIGDNIQSITSEDICRSNCLMYAAVICELVCIALMAGVLIIVQ